MLQHGGERVARSLRVGAGDGVTGQTIATEMGSARPVQADNSAAATVFSRFLRQLTYLELPPTTTPVPEMQWFPPTRAVV